MGSFSTITTIVNLSQKTKPQIHTLKRKQRANQTPKAKSKSKQNRELKQFEYN